MTSKFEYLSIKTAIAEILARKVFSSLENDSRNAVEIQDQLLRQLVKKAAQTKFGQDHEFSSISSVKEFQAKVPIRDYEELKEYIEQAVEGKPDILWPGRPQYFAKTSGTTSGAKFIPITRSSIRHQVTAARNMLLCYVHLKKSADLLLGKLIFLQGSPSMKKENGILIGRLSGIVAHHVPSYLQKNRLPSWEVNILEDWEQKVDAIVKETYHQDMRMISGIPPWMQMYFDRLQAKEGKKIKELFPNFNLLVHGGVNFAPYKGPLLASIGKEIDIVETYPASEGFFAFQNDYRENGLLLNVRGGIFYEFVDLSHWGSEEARRLSLAEVEVGVNYVMIISTDAGLWGYNIGDTVRFLSISPYKIEVTGRIKHFISAFGEHVIAQEVSDALATSCQEMGGLVREFTVAPEVSPSAGLPYHEWFIDFEKLPDSMERFSAHLDEQVRQRNSYYDDLITGQVLQPLKIKQMKPRGFERYMDSIGKLGGQNKVPRVMKKDQFEEWEAFVQEEVR